MFLVCSLIKGKFNLFKLDLKEKKLGELKNYCKVRHSEWNEESGSRRKFR